MRYIDAREISLSLTISFTFRPLQIDGKRIHAIISLEMFCVKTMFDTEMFAIIPVTATSP